MVKEGSKAFIGVVCLHTEICKTKAKLEKRLVQTFAYEGKRSEGGNFACSAESAKNLPHEQEPQSYKVLNHMVEL